MIARRKTCARRRWYYTTTLIQIMTFTSLVLLFCNAVEAQDLRWRLFANARFGSMVEVPTGLFSNGMVPPLDDGIHFEKNADGATLSVWGSVMIQPSRPYQEICRDECQDESYRVDLPTLAATSGVIAEQIYYKKCTVVKADIVAFHCFSIGYPSSLRARYDSIVAHMSNSLR